MFQYDHKYEIDPKHLSRHARARGLMVQAISLISLKTQVYGNLYLIYMSNIKKIAFYNFLRGKEIYCTHTYKVSHLVSSIIILTKNILTNISSNNSSFAFINIFFLITWPTKQKSYIRVILSFAAQACFSWEAADRCALWYTVFHWKRSRAAW